VLQDPLFFATAVPAVLLFGLSKGGLGGGAGILAVPLMALVSSPAQAAAVMLPVLLVMDAMGLWAYRRDADRPALAVLIPGGLVGIVLASLVFGLMSDDVVRLVIGVIAVGFCLWRWLPIARPGAARRPPAAAGVFWGALGGFTSTLAHAGGPPVNIYLLALRLSPAGFVGTMVYLFAAVNLAKVPPYALLGLFTRETLTASLLLVPIAVLGMGLGIRLLRVIDASVFYKIVYVLVFLTGLKLLWDGSAALRG
jgi:uncharacterized membrane protein YfcA